MLLFSDLADTKVLASWQNKTAARDVTWSARHFTLPLIRRLDFTIPSASSLLTFSKLSGDNPLVKISAFCCVVSTQTISTSLLSTFDWKQEVVFYHDVF